ncbi:MAG: diaminopimelate decarboxylase [Thermodesulfobacteriota bacterium]
MHYFQYKDGDLYCEKVPIAAIADSVGTPFYLYSHKTLVRHFKAFDSAFEKVRHLVCYSVKANSNLALLRVFVNLGAGLDVVSGGELFRALKSGVDPKKVVFSGVGKTGEEIEYALNSGILMFNAESSQELARIDEIGGRLGTRAPVALRINPDVDPKTHPYVATGLRENKFGIDFNLSMAEYIFAKGLPHVEIIGVDCHIGSQLIELEPFVEALRKVKELIHALGQRGIEIQYLDLGGGLGITYKDEVPPHPTEYARAIVEEASDLDYTLIFEPGRVIVGNAGVLVSRVLYTKETGQKNFVIIDAGMNDLIRPSLYGSFQGILPVAKGDGEEIVADVVGPICESGDFIAKNRRMPKFNPGDLVAVMSAGAYGFSMSSNYNARPRVCEVLARGNRFHLIRERENYEDLIRGEKIPDFLV